MTAGAPRPTIGIDVGGTKILGAVVAGDGTLLEQRRVPSPDDVGVLVRAMAGVARELCGNRSDTSAIGVGIAGLVGLDGVLRYSPNLPGAIDLPIQTDIAAATGKPVIVDNDANVAGYGEVVHGAAAGLREVVMVTLGTGIGGAIISNGQVLRGAHGFAGEIGHFTVDRGGPLCACGERGHWEAIASGTALARMAREAVASGKGAAILAAAGGIAGAVDGHAVGRAATAGDADARAVLHAFAENVAIGLVALANILDPELFVISGGLVGLGALLFDPLHAAFALHLEGGEHRPPVALVPSVLGERAGVIGAAALARTIA